MEPLSPSVRQTLPWELDAGGPRGGDTARPPSGCGLALPVARGSFLHHLCLLTLALLETPVCRVRAAHAGRGPEGAGRLGFARAAGSDVGSYFHPLYFRSIKKRTKLVKITAIRESRETVCLCQAIGGSALVRFLPGKGARKDSFYPN